MAKVVGFAKSGSIRVCSFKFKSQWWDADAKEWIDREYWERTGPYTVQYSERVFVTDESRVDPALIEYINVELNGDPLYDSTKGKI